MHVAINQTTSCNPNNIPAIPAAKRATSALLIDVARFGAISVGVIVVRETWLEEVTEAEADLKVYPMLMLDPAGTKIVEPELLELKPLGAAADTTAIPKEWFQRLEKPSRNMERQHTLIALCFDDFGSRVGVGIGGAFDVCAGDNSWITKRV